MMQEFIDGKYGKKLRIRVSGILVEKEKILLIKHKGIGEAGHLWAPPGGGMEYGQKTVDNLVREFREETGLQIEVVNFMFINEVLRPPLHAIELFYLVKRIGGELKLGSDPESDAAHQILDSINFFSFTRLEKMNQIELHNLFAHCNSIPELLKMNGYFNY